MFQNLSKRITAVFDQIRGRGFISENDLNDALREIRIALLEADVALVVVKEFITQVRERALGHEVTKSVSPGQMIIKIVHEHLIDLLGADEAKTQINLSAKPPVSMMMVGLQGSGKTTTSGKLALYLKEKRNKKVLLVSLDIYRPAAQHQLEVVGKSVQVESLPIVEGEKPLQIVTRAMERAKTGGFDVVLYDTAGRLHIDDTLMDELSQLVKTINPLETLLVVDAMTGQDAVSIATGFKAVVPLTGLILTRVDGDSRGGAALSMRSITQCPIKFLGVGEKSSQFEVFDAKRIADRILDMGDIVALVERAGELQNSEETQKAMERMQKGQFDMNDMATQLQQMQKMGGMSSMMNMIPGMGKLKDKVENLSGGDVMVKRQLAIISSMTKKERKQVGILNGSRRKRIAAGAGVQVSDVNRLVKQFEQMQAMVKKMGKMSVGGIAKHKMAQMLGGMFGGQR